MLSKDKGISALCSVVLMTSIFKDLRPTSCPRMQLLINTWMIQEKYQIYS